MARIACLIYSIDSATEASCALPNGVVGCLRLPSTPIPDALRGAHFLAPVPVELLPPLTITHKAKNKGAMAFECAGLYVLPKDDG